MVFLVGSRVLFLPLNPVDCLRASPLDSRLLDRLGSLQLNPLLLLHDNPVVNPVSSRLRSHHPGLLDNLLDSLQCNRLVNLLRPRRDSRQGNHLVSPHFSPWPGQQVYQVRSHPWFPPRNLLVCLRVNLHVSPLESHLGSPLHHLLESLPANPVGHQREFLRANQQINRLLNLLVNPLLCLLFDQLASHRDNPPRNHRSNRLLGRLVNHHDNLLGNQLRSLQECPADNQLDSQLVILVCSLPDNPLASLARVPQVILQCNPLVSLVSNLPVSQLASQQCSLK